MLVRLVLGLLALKVVAANPRFSRQVDLDSYDGTSYDVDLDNFNLENHELYDYEDSVTIDDPQVRSNKGVPMVSLYSYRCLSKWSIANSEFSRLLPFIGKNGNYSLKCLIIKINGLEKHVQS